VADRRVARALEECLRALRAGASIEECLAAHPELSQELRPLLEAALRLKPVPVRMAEESRNFYRQRMLADIRAERAARRAARPFFSLPRLLVVPALAAALVAALVVGLNPTQAPDVAQAATLLTVIEGEVSIETLTGAVAGQTGMHLKPGDRIVTHSNARAVLTFPDGSSVTMESETVLAIQSVADREGGRISVKLTQSQGRTWTHLPPAFGQADIEIHTPSAKLQAAKDASFTTSVDADGRTQVGAQSGDIELQSGERRSAVKSGEKVVVDLPGVVSVPSAEPPPKELLVRVTGAIFVFLTDPAGATVGTVAPGIPVNQVTGATAVLRGNDILIRVPEPRDGSYRLGIRSLVAGKINVEATLGESDKDSLSFDVQPGDDWIVNLRLVDDELEFGRANRPERPTPPNVALGERAVERALATAAAGAPPAATTRPERPTATPTPTPTPTMSPFPLAATPTPSPSPAAAATPPPPTVSP
jgi:hypothetical protein